jgi:hypothetical protein
MTVMNGASAPAAATASTECESAAARLLRNPGEALSAAVQFTTGLGSLLADMARGFMTPQVLNPQVALTLTGDPIQRTTETLRLALSGASFLRSGQELLNKGEIFTLVPAVSGLIGVPARAPLNLPELVARSYCLGPFFSLWAIEGLGHDYGDSFWNQGTVPSRILSPEVTRDLPPGSLPMLHAGIGLSIAQTTLKGLPWNAPAEEVRRRVSEILRLDRENSLPGYVGAAYESLGLVSRTLHPTMVSAVDRVVREVAPELRGYFWHGVGRAIYFWVFNFLPCSDWQIFEMARREAPDEEALLNAWAGAAWGYTLVNMRQPGVMAELLIGPHGEDLARNGGFSNGLASSVIMRYDTTPDAPFIEPFIHYRPRGSRRVAELWDRLVQIPGETALKVYYPVISQHRRVGDVFRYQDLAAYVGHLQESPA